MQEQSDPMPSIASGTPVRFASGSVLFRPGDPCGGLLIVKSGAIRVQTTSETGRQITLYRVARNVACVLSTQCLMTGGVYPAEGIAETDVTGVFVGAAEVETLVVENGPFRRWLFDAYGTRLSNLVLVIEDLLGSDIDGKLARYLLGAADGDGTVKRTHQAIAAELGTAREVVSRHLKDFERQGSVALRRGVVELLDRSGLQARAAQ